MRATGPARGESHAGADANPYLAIAASLAAGLAGMQEQLAPSAAIEGNGYDQAHTLARSCLMAHDQLVHSAHAARLLAADFVRAYLAANQMEHDSYLREISAWERRLLLPQV